MLNSSVQPLRQYQIALHLPASGTWKSLAESLNNTTQHKSARCFIHKMWWERWASSQYRAFQSLPQGGHEPMRFKLNAYIEEIILRCKIHFVSVVNRNSVFALSESMSQNRKSQKQNKCVYISKKTFAGRNLVLWKFSVTLVFQTLAHRNIFLQNGGKTAWLPVYLVIVIYMTYFS